MKRIHAFLAAVLILGLIAITSCENVTTETEEESSLAQPSLGTIQAGSTSMFTGNEKHNISLSTANDLIDRYAQKSADEPNGWYFGGDAILALLAQDSAVGLRIYHALKEDGEHTPVIFGVTRDGNDLGADHRLQKSFSDSAIIILDVALPCPPYCGGIDDGG